MNITELWTEALTQLKSHLNQESLEIWIKPLAIESVIGQEVTFSVPNNFIKEWIREHYYILLQNVLRDLTNDPLLAVNLIVKDEIPTIKSAVAPTPQATHPRSKYTFSTFVVGPSNEFAHAACMKVAERPGVTYNPLYIYGGVGLGKTHLLSAIGNLIRQKFPSNWRTTYVTAEQFTTEVIHSIRHDRMIEFKNKYRSVDVLLIDDIQFITKKERTQEEFFHTFNTLYEAGRQIVIASDRSTRDMAALEIEERLRSRFEMGLIADIQPPDYETRVAILKKKAEQEGISLPEEVADYIATNIKTNVRDLEGSLIKLGAFSMLLSRQVTLELARQVLRDRIQERRRYLTTEEIQQVVSAQFRLKPADLKSHRRTKVLVYPRHIAMYLAKRLTNLSFPEIGRQFGDKDHSTIIHAVAQIDARAKIDAELRALLTTLTKKLEL